MEVLSQGGQVACKQRREPKGGGWGSHQFVSLSRPRPSTHKQVIGFARGTREAIGGAIGEVFGAAFAEAIRETIREAIREAIWEAIWEALGEGIRESIGQRTRASCVAYGYLHRKAGHLVTLLVVVEQQGIDGNSAGKAVPADRP